MNTVELIGYYGSDQIHAQSAWTSTSRDIDEERIKKIPELLKMLADNGHETPFEKSSLHFLVNVDQATHIHLIKHRIGVSINGESARYKELKEDKTYIPDDWPDEWKERLELYAGRTNELYHKALVELTPLLGRKRAKESARYFKMFNSQITMDIMFNWRSFIHFYKLRSDDHAQQEVRNIAIEMLNLIKNIDGNPFEYTIRSFNLS